MMTIQVDSREHAHAIEKILGTFLRYGVGYHISKNWVGDYVSLDKPRYAIDRKRSLLELCGNMCQQHERFKNECQRAKDAGVKLVFLIEHGRGVQSIEDVEESSDGGHLRTGSHRGHVLQQELETERKGRDGDGRVQGLVRGERGNK